jgi:hypothetical protein
MTERHRNLERLALRDALEDVDHARSRVVEHDVEWTVGVIVNRRPRPFHAAPYRPGKQTNCREPFFVGRIARARQRVA